MDVILQPGTGQDHSQVYTCKILINICRFINKDPEKFVDEFLPEISAKIGAILEKVLNSVLQNVEARYMIDSA